MPRDATSLEELERIVARMTARENRWLVYKQRAARMGIGLEPDELWLLARIGESGPMPKSELEGRLHISGVQCEALLARLVTAGMATEATGGIVALSAEGGSDYRRLLQQREKELQEMLADWHPNAHPEVLAMMRTLANSLRVAPLEAARRLAH